MLVSSIGLAALKSREGVKLKAYQDSVGVWTIGYGSTKGVKRGDIITQAQADALLSKDIDSHAKPILDAVKVKLELADHEADALVSIAFNIGVGGFKGSTFLRLLNSGDRAGCAKAMLAWRKPPEILTRRKAEQAQFLTPYSVALPKARSTDAKPVVVRKVVPVQLADLGDDLPPEETAAGEDIDMEGDNAPISEPVDLNPDEVKALQTKLRALGYAEVGIPTGEFGSKTAGAVSAFQKQEGLPITGGADKATLARLSIAQPRPVSTERASLSSSDIRASSAPVQQTFRAKVWAGVTAAGGVVLTAFQGVTSFFGEAREKLAPVQEFFHDIPPVVWFGGATGVAVLLWHLSRSSEAGQVEQVRTGETAGPAG